MGTITRQARPRRSAVRALAGILTALIAATGITAVSTVVAAPAFAGPTYQVIDADNDPYNGIYLRQGTSMGNVSRTAEWYVTYGTSVELLCGTWGESVGPYSNRRWHQVKVLNGSNAGRIGYVADRYTNTPNAANQATPGEPECGSAPSGGGTSTPATTYINTSTPVRMCTNLGDGSCRGVWTLPANTAVTMICYRDESTYANSPRWFWVDGGGYSGFVSAPHVSKQTSVGHCDSNKAITAIRWAGSHLDEDFMAGWCQSFVYEAYRAAGIDIGRAPSAAAYNSQNPRGYARDNSYTPPAGALPAWGARPGYPDGHVALAIGNGWAISTLERSTRPVHIIRISDRASMAWVGSLLPR